MTTQIKVSDPNTGETATIYTGSNLPTEPSGKQVDTALSKVSQTLEKGKVNLSTQVCDIEIGHFTDIFP